MVLVYGTLLFLRYFSCDINLTFLATSTSLFLRYFSCEVDSLREAVEANVGKTYSPKSEFVKLGQEIELTSYSFEAKKDSSCASCMK
eukprot:g5405.t1